MLDVVVSSPACFVLVNMVYAFGIVSAVPLVALAGLFRLIIGMSGGVPDKLDRSSEIGQQCVTIFLIIRIHGLTTMISSMTTTRSLNERTTDSMVVRWV